MAAPCCSTAWEAKLEHDGAKRHPPGRKGETKRRYARSERSNTRAATPRRATSPVDGEVEALRELGGHLGIGQIFRTGFRDDD